LNGDAVDHAVAYFFGNTSQNGGDENADLCSPGGAAGLDSKGLVVEDHGGAVVGNLIANNVPPSVDNSTNRYVFAPTLLSKKPGNNVRNHLRVAGT
jgi:hypothetical protein